MLDLPVLLINLGGDERMLAGDVNPRGSGLAGSLPAPSIRGSPGIHFTFLGMCKPGGSAELIAENDDPVCDDPEGADRAEVHAEVIARIAKFLGL